MSDIVKGELTPFENSECAFLISKILEELGDASRSVWFDLRNAHKSSGRIFG
jgi:hypothetical protein